MTLIITRRMMVSAALLVSSLIAACGPHSTNPSTETLTINQDAPTLNPLDLGPPGNSPGDVYYFSAPLRSSPGGRVIGEVFGSKTLIKPGTDAKPNLEQHGHDGAEFDAGQPVVRATLGGTGKYMGARGQLISTRNADGSYTQVLTLVS